MKSLREWLLTEMPRYIDHDYDFKPIDDRGMSFLTSSSWDEIPLNDSMMKDKDFKLFVNKRRTMVFCGLTYFNDDSKSWRFAVITYLKLEKHDKWYQVVSASTLEEYRGRNIALSVYSSLIDHGIKLMSDYEQYSGAKSLWKDLSKKYHVEIIDKSNIIIIAKYDIRTNKDNEIWSRDYSKFDVVLRVK